MWMLSFKTERVNKVDVHINREEIMRELSNVISDKKKDSLFL